jgi:hypothetical protein
MNESVAYSSGNEVEAECLIAYGVKLIPHKLSQG